jgi:N-acetylmuramoyl-L-alanine amidase
MSLIFPRIACPSPNFDMRRGKAVNMLLLHYTGMQSASAALDRLCDAEAKVSAHYTVDEDGAVYVHVPEEERAWHAGKAYWAGETDINACSIGIEIVNPGHTFGYRSFPDVQVASVIALAQDIVARHAIPAHRVLAHSDVAPARKADPGELFPWAQLAEQGVGLWPAQGAPLKGDFAAGLARFGYSIGGDTDVGSSQAIVAFQRHFRPSKFDGVVDAECAAILAALLEAAAL